MKTLIYRYPCSHKNKEALAICICQNALYKVFNKLEKLSPPEFFIRAAHSSDFVKKNVLFFNFH